MADYLKRAAMIFACMAGCFAVVAGIGWLLIWLGEHFGFFGFFGGFCLLASLGAASVPDR